MVPNFIIFRWAVKLTITSEELVRKWDNTVTAFHQGHISHADFYKWSSSSICWKLIIQCSIIINIHIVKCFTPNIWRNIEPNRQNYFKGNFNSYGSTCKADVILTLSNRKEVEWHIILKNVQCSFQWKPSLWFFDKQLNLPSYQWNWLGNEVVLSQLSIRVNKSRELVKLRFLIKTFSAYLNDLPLLSIQFILFRCSVLFSVSKTFWN